MITSAGVNGSGQGAQEVLCGGERLLADSPKLGKGDAALLRFAAAAEILESDFWIQYNELGGKDIEVPGGSGNPIYTAKLQNRDSDFPQYIHDNTDDEITHFTFLNAYLMSKGTPPANLEQFRTLPGSTAYRVRRKATTR